MHWKGRAVVTWTEIESRGKSKVTVLYVAGEDYFDQCITIWGKGTFLYIPHTHLR